MNSLDNVTIRINGVEQPSIRYRYSIQDGFPGGDPELVVADPICGEFTLTNDCQIQIQYGKGAWQQIRLPELIQIVKTNLK